MADGADRFATGGPVLAPEDRATDVGLRWLRWIDQATRGDDPPDHVRDALDRLDEDEARWCVQYLIGLHTFDLKDPSTLGAPMAAVPPVVVPVTVQFTGDEIELLTAALELCADIREHLPHRAVFETAERIAEVAQAIARVLEVVEP